MSSIARLVFSVLGEVRRVMEKDAEREGKLYSGLGFIKREMEMEMEMVDALIKDTKEEYQGGAVQETRIRQLQELAYDVEDFVEGLWEPGEYGKVLVAIGMDRRRLQRLDRIDYFKDRASTLIKDWKQSAEPSAPPPPPAAASEEELVGIDGPKRKIVELLSPWPAEGQQLRVISIVGCRGVGKIALARSVYNDSIVRQQFEYVAWFVASGCKDATALVEMAPENDETEEGCTTAPAHLRAIPADKRYLVFIDDVWQAQVLMDAIEACPKNNGSRIIVTTSIQSVATACSSGSYVYNMQCLSHDDSKKLFWRKVYGCPQKEPPHSLVTDSKGIFSKCGGLPLALTSAARHLSINGTKLESRHCKEVENLGR